MEFEWLNDSRTPNKRDEITPPRSPRLPAPTKVTRICGNLTTSQWPGRHNPRIPDDTIALVRELARLMPDRQIASAIEQARDLPIRHQPRQLTHECDRVVGDAWIVPAGRIQSLFDLQLGMVAALPVQDRM